MIEDERKKRKEIIIEFMGRNPYYKHACMFAGISVETLDTWRKEDVDFSDKLEAMRAQTLTKHVNRSSPEFILTHADPETFNIAKKTDLTSGGKELSLLGGISKNAIHTDNGNGEDNKTE